jgi:PEP-CTERM motif
MIRARSACLVALLGLVFFPMVVSALEPCATANECQPVVPVPEPATLLLMAPAAALLWRARRKKKSS